MVAFLFPGQGSQYVGMGKDLYEQHQQARKIFQKADEVLGFKISELCFQGPQDKLRQTYNCQLAILTMSIAVWQTLKSSSSSTLSAVSYVAGLSLGEYSALVANDALSFEDALRLVGKRAELMQEAARINVGKMAAIIGLNREEVKNICSSIDKVVVANLNCPGQVVVSGSKEAVDQAKELAIHRGAKRAIDLEVSGAFHSPFMAGAAEKFNPYLEAVNFNTPRIPLVSNVDAVANTDKLKIRQNLVRQIYSPVLWEDSMCFIISRGIDRFYELGPGKVLKGLMRNIDKSVEVINIEKREDIINFGG